MEISGDIRRKQEIFVYNRIYPEILTDRKRRGGGMGAVFTYVCAASPTFFEYKRSSYAEYIRSIYRLNGSPGKRVAKHEGAMLPLLD